MTYKDEPACQVALETWSDGHRAFSYCACSWRSGLQEGYGAEVQARHLAREHVGDQSAAVPVGSSVMVAVEAVSAEIT